MKASLGAMALIIVILFGACTVEQELVLGHEYSGLWSLEGRPMPFVDDVLEDLAILGGYDSSGAFYDEAISKTITNLETRADVEDFELRRVGKHAWAAKVMSSDIRSLFGDAALGGIADISREGDMHTLSLKFDSARAAELENLLPILKEPAFSLFNPAENEGLSEEEYITEVLGFTFGEENLLELRQSMVQLSVTVPGTVTEVEGGIKLSENSARFKAPLTRFLVPEREIVWVVSWSRDPLSGG